MFKQTRKQESLPNHYFSKVKIVFISFTFLLLQVVALGQIDGSWQGVLIQNNQDGTTTNFAVWVELKSEGRYLSGKFRSEQANTPYFKVSKILGKIDGSNVVFKEDTILNHKTEEGFGWCSIIASFIYNQQAQKLKGSYTSRTKGCVSGELVLVKSNKQFNSDKTAITETTTLNKIQGLLEEKKSIIGKQFVLADVNFQSAKYSITASSYAYLNEIVKLLKENLNIKIHLKGNTDSDGDDENNFILSQKRAESVADYLVKKGIAINRITFEGYGESRPIGENETKDGKQVNRRVELLIISE
ncbi:MAG: OmpA family protein [Flavobacteriales bacterium]|nr:OmpA family protein [Flavobacteriales bacterium]